MSGLEWVVRELVSRDPVASFAKREWACDWMDAMGHFKRRWFLDHSPSEPAASDRHYGSANIPDEIVP